MKYTINRVVLYLSIASLTIFAWSCKSVNPCQQNEILRKASQDNLVDFVVIEKDCGATTSVSTQIFIVPTGRTSAELTPVFVADHVEGLEVSWVAPKQMAITYKEARIFSYTNFWQSRDVENFSYTVAIKEYQK